MKKNYFYFKNTLPTTNRKNLFSILFFFLSLVAAFGQSCNVVKNSTFDSDISNWTSSQASGAGWSTYNGQAYIDRDGITAPGISLRQPLTGLIRNSSNTLTVSFKIKGQNADRLMCGTFATLDVKIGGFTYMRINNPVNNATITTSDITIYGTGTTYTQTGFSITVGGSGTGPGGTKPGIAENALTSGTITLTIPWSPTTAAATTADLEFVATSSNSLVGTGSCAATWGGDDWLLDDISVVASNPTVFNMTGSNSCSGVNTAIGLNSSQLGVNYQLRRDGSNVGSVVAGTGSGISFGNQSTLGVYTVLATAGTTTCTTLMNGSVEVYAASAGGTLSGGVTASICQGGSTGTLTLSGYTGTIIRWERQLNGGGWSNVGGYGSTTYSEVPYAAGSWQYRAVVQNNSCAEAYSSIKNVTVDATPVGGGVYSGNTPVCLNGSTGNMTLGGGYVGTVVRWEKRLLPSATWTNIANTSAVYSENPSVAGTWEYRALVGSGNCPSVYSSAFSVVVNPELTITLGSNPAICQTTTTASLSYTATTGNPTHWVLDFDSTAISAGFSNQNGNLNTAPSSITVNVPYSVASGVYNASLRVITYNPVCSSVVYPITITVSTPPVLTITPVNICVGGSGSLSVSGACSGGAISTGATDAGATDAGATAGQSGGGTGDSWSNRNRITSDNDSYVNSNINNSSRELYTSDYGFSIPSNAIITGIQVTIGRYAENSNSLHDNKVNLIYSGSEIATNKASSSYWSTSETVASYGSSSDVWGATLTPAIINDNSFGIVLDVDNDNSNNRTAYVDYIQINVSYTVGEVEWYTASSGGSPIATGTSFNPVGVAGSGLANTNTAGTTTYYAACSTNPGCRVAANFVINSTPTIVSITTPAALCSGSSLNLTAPSVTANGSTISSQGWQISTTSGGSTYTALTVPYTVAFADNGKNIRYTATNGCGTTTSNVVVLTVSPASVGGTVAGSTTVCKGTNSVTLTLSGHTGNIVRWESSLDNFATAATTIANTTTSLTATNLTATTSYRAVLQSGVCSTANSASATVTVNPIQSITLTTSNASVCQNTITTTLAYSATVGSPTQWHIDFDAAANTAGITDQSNNLSGTSGTITISVPGSVAAGVYQGNLTVTGTSCPSVAYPITLTVTAAPSSPIVSDKSDVSCSSLGSVKLSGLPASGTIVQTKNGTTDNYTIIAGGTQTITELGSGNYTFAVSNGSCVSASVNVIIDGPVTNTYSASGWSTGALPTIDQKVIFNVDYSSSSDLDACSCKVAGIASVVINSNHTLKVQNEVEVTPNAKLTFENNASLVQINDNAVNKGNINYHRHTTPVKRYDFTYWSSPVVDQTLKKLSPNTLYDKYYSYNSGWVISYSGVATMVPGNGYIIRAPQPFSITVASVDTNPTFIGEPNNGLVSFSLAGNKTHLLGNPYPSAMDADVFLDVNSAVLQGTLYFWTHNSPPSTAVSGTAKYNYTTNDYATYNRTGGVGTGAAAKVDSDVNDPNNNNNLSVPTGKIAAGQGFFAPASAAGGTVVFNNRMRVVGGTNGVNNKQFFKLATTSKTSTTNVASIEKNRVWLNLTNNEGAFKQTLVGYITGATNDYDGAFDGVTYDGNQFVDFYSVNNSVNLSIQGRALPFVKKDSVALGYKSTIKGDFQISIDHTDGVLTTQNVFLEDKDLKVLHDLKKEAYTFSTEKGIFNDRFVLRYVDKNVVEPVIEEPVIEVPVVDVPVVDKTVLVSVNKNQISVSSTEDLISKITVYDILGKVLYRKEAVAASDFIIPYLISSQQVLLVNVVLVNGKTTSTKIIY